MKKLILGLLMTVGISTFALANDIKLDKEVVSCSYTTIIKIVNCDGTSNYVGLPSVAGACGDNEEGSVVIVRKTVTQECGPVGPITDIN